MKRLILILLVALSGNDLYAQASQKDSLGFDENNKYIYYQVVAQPGLNADSIYRRALYFLQAAYSKDKLKLKKQEPANGVLKGEGGFMVSKKALVSKHDDGRITYDLNIEVKDGKYRYWLTNFVIIPYERDRYANFVPVNGKKTPLEHALRLLGQKDLDDYLEKVLVNSRFVGDRLKNFILSPAPSVKKERKIAPVIKKDW
ncbi:DUF4468 domain-containing protein [Mucilaginibacter defluvii]|uniref:DUF4468 domain-containing protein n=1 Tax=Mucilaginibacter defluvii TaxID=1196019 RepID=A0ABP9G2E4_9SPHI